MNRQQLYQLSAMFANLASGVYPQVGQGLKEMAQSGIQGEAVKKQKEEEEKKKKAGMFGSVGSTLGSIAGVVAAPFTGGTSLAATAAMGALGGAAGGAAGTLAGGGDLSANQILMDAAMGGVSGAGAHLLGPVLAKGGSAVTGALTPATPSTAALGGGTSGAIATGATTPFTGAAPPLVASNPAQMAATVAPTKMGMSAGQAARQMATQNLLGVLGTRSIGSTLGVFPQQMPAEHDPNQRTSTEYLRRMGGGFEPLSGSYFGGLY
jgi:hypothetical protein